MFLNLVCLGALCTLTNWLFLDSSRNDSPFLVDKKSVDSPKLCSALDLRVFVPLLCPVEIVLIRRRCVVDVLSTDGDELSSGQCVESRTGSTSDVNEPGVNTLSTVSGDSPKANLSFGAHQFPQNCKTSSSTACRIEGSDSMIDSVLRHACSTVV